METKEGKVYPEIQPSFFIWIGFQKHQIWFWTLVTIISVFYGKAYLIFWHVEKFHLLWLEPTPTLISHHTWQHTGITHILFVKLSLCFYCPKIRETWDYWELHDRFESLSGSAPQNIQKLSLISLNDRFVWKMNMNHLLWESLKNCYLFHGKRQKREKVLDEMKFFYAEQCWLLW